MQNLLACQIAHDFSLPSDPEDSPAQLVADAISDANDSMVYADLLEGLADIVVIPLDVSGELPEVEARIEIVLDYIESQDNFRKRLAERLREMAGKLEGE